MDPFLFFEARRLETGDAYRFAAGLEPLSGLEAPAASVTPAHRSRRRTITEAHDGEASEKRHALARPMIAVVLHLTHAGQATPCPAKFE